MPVELRCIEEGHTDKRWLLEVRGQLCVLLDVNGSTVAKFSRGDAQKRFRTPSITDGTRHFSIVLDEQTVRFDVAPSSVAQIEDFLNRTAPPPAVAAMRLELTDPNAASRNRLRGGAAIFVKLAVGGLATMFATSMVLRLVESQVAAGRPAVDMPTTIVGAAAGLVLAIGCIHSVLRGPSQRELVARADPVS